ncbi:MAG: rhamnulokinase [Rikenellaceae bacterium]|nr:rhamnulokinase [Rikenellaceae bacterium]
MGKSFLAFDIGATSGRAMLGTLDAGRLTLRELTRFPNRFIELHGHYHWNIFSLYEHLIEGLRTCEDMSCPVESLGIDTWGVDFAMVGADGAVMGLPYAYRDRHTQGAPEAFFKRVPRREVYETTGIQVMDFNSLYQLFALRREGSSQLAAARHILFMPDALAYMLTGSRVTEYTIASTSQMLDPRTRTFDARLLAAAGVDPSLLGEVVLPGHPVGTLTASLARESGLGRVPVVAVAGHDTASAVASVPAVDGHFAYLSSGTWSLMGIESPHPIINDQTYAANLTNEGGVEGTTRVLKNITGMWLLEQCLREWKELGRAYSYGEIVAMAEGGEPFRTIVDPDDPALANPDSMTGAIAAYCRRTGQPVPATDAQYVRCIFESLALRYRHVFETLRRIAPFPIERLHIIGGGSRNRLLNQFTANALCIPVIAGPAEATAIGNVMIQARTAGLVSSLADMRQVIARSVPTERFAPRDHDAWTVAYGRAKALYND